MIVDGEWTVEVETFDVMENTSDANFSLPSFSGLGGRGTKTGSIPAPFGTFIGMKFL